MMLKAMCQEAGYYILEYSCFPRDGVCGWFSYDKLYPNLIERLSSVLAKSDRPNPLRQAEHFLSIIYLLLIICSRRTTWHYEGKSTNEVHISLRDRMLTFSTSPLNCPSQRTQTFPKHWTFWQQNHVIKGRWNIAYGQSCKFTSTKSTIERLRCTDIFMALWAVRWRTFDFAD